MKHMHRTRLFCRLEITQCSELAGHGVDLLLLAERGQIPLIHGLGVWNANACFCSFVRFSGLKSSISLICKDIDSLKIGFDK